MAHQHENTQVVLTTDSGAMRIEFFTDKAPGHVENFVKLAKDGFYDGTCFHRVMSGFMIQGGDPNTKTEDRGRWGTGGPGWTIDAEFNDVHHERGVLSMARSSNPNSAGSQFFIVHGEAGFLDGQYTAFGRVVEGLEVLDAIAGAPVESSGGGEMSSPVTPVRVQSAEVVETAS